MLLVFVLLLVYQLKHWVCDFPLQTEWMLGKFKEKGWALPLAAHAGVHGAATFLIAFFLMSSGWVFALHLALLDFGVHFVMDRIKASPNLMGRWKSLSAKAYQYSVRTIETPNIHSELQIRQAKAAIKGNKLFWWALGIDQMVHHLTHYAIIYLLVH